MSIKHVKSYYNGVCEDYHEMINLLHELEEEAQTTVVPPEKIENLKEIIKPLKDNYERWSWMIFLLNQPNKKEKKKKYERQNEKLIKEFKEKNDLSAIKEEDKKVLNDLNNAFK